MKKIIATIMSIIIVLATTIMSAGAYYDGSQGNGETEIKAQAYSSCIVTIPATCDFIQQSEADISVDSYNLDTNNTITVYANNINDDDTLTVYHDTKEGVTANLTLNRLGDDGMINDTNIVQQNNPILAQFDYSSLENGETVKQFGGYFRNEVSAGHYSGTMTYSIYINES